MVLPLSVALHSANEKGSPTIADGASLRTSKMET